MLSAQTAGIGPVVVWKSGTSWFRDLVEWCNGRDSTSSLIAASEDESLSLSALRLWVASKRGPTVLESDSFSRVLGLRSGSRHCGTLADFRGDIDFAWEPTTCVSARPFGRSPLSNGQAVGQRDSERKEPEPAAPTGSIRRYFLETSSSWRVQELAVQTSRQRVVEKARG